MNEIKNNAYRLPLFFFFLSSLSDEPSKNPSLAPLFDEEEANNPAPFFGSDLLPSILLKKSESDSLGLNKNLLFGS